MRWKESTDDFDPKIDSTPVRTKVFGNGKIYADLTAVLLERPKKEPLGPTITFEAFITQQAPWVQDLLSYVQIRTNDNKTSAVETITKCHDKEGHLLSVSDGSVKYIHNMSFG